MADPEDESSHDRNNRLLIDRITTRMEQIMNRHLDAFEKQMREIFQAEEKSRKKKKKSTSPQPSSEVKTCLKKDLDNQSQAKCKLPSSESKLVLDNENTCAKLTCLEPVQPSSIESLSQVQEEIQPEESQRSFPLIVDLEQPASHEPEPIPKPLSHHHPKHCKETSVFNVKPSLFVLVSAQEEKRFGLENVKEFCVSINVFDKMFSTFETFKLEEFCRQKGFLFDGVCDHRHNLLRNCFGLELTESNFWFDECFARIEHFLPASKVCELNSVLKQNVFESFPKLEPDFAWFEIVLPKFRPIVL